MKTIVVYQSKYGYTKKYAEWLSKELNCDRKENAKLEDIIGYDRILCGGGIYAGSMNGLKLITKNLNKLSGKRLVLFAVGLNSGHKEELERFWKKLLNEEQYKTIPHFFLRGGFDYQKLNTGDKLCMLALRKMLQRKKNPDEETKGLLAAYDTPINFTDKNNLKELLEYVKQM